MGSRPLYFLHDSLLHDCSSPFGGRFALPAAPVPGQAVGIATLHRFLRNHGDGYQGVTTLRQYIDTIYPDNAKSRGRAQEVEILSPKSTAPSVLRYRRAPNRSRVVRLPHWSQPLRGSLYRRSGEGTNGAVLYRAAGTEAILELEFSGTRKRAKGTAWFREAPEKPAGMIDWKQSA